MVDLWEPETSRRQRDRHLLTSVEVTVTNRCNLRCRHCAVGETLTHKEPDRIPLALLFERLDEVETLQTLSVTGGEPSENLTTLRDYVLPILQYARRRGLKTQVNTNLTYELERYRLIAPYVDVFHISWNYTGVGDFHRVVWGHDREGVSPVASAMLYQRIIENSRALAEEGCFVSAESMINRDTAPHLGAMNRFLAELGCRRHEVHPMYAVDWGMGLTDLVLSLDQYREAVDRFLAERTPDLWVLFGTFPFLPCSPDQRDRALLDRARRAPNVTIRNCPDGRNRVNVNGFTGEVFVTDFADVPALGNLFTGGLEQAFDRWQNHPAFAPYNCYCPEAGCTGPNLVVANMYHGGVDFRLRRAQV